MTNTASAWFQSARSLRQAKLKIFCFPYAGGAASVYKNWPDLLPPTVRVIPVELPGRGTRLKDPPFVSMPALIGVLAEAILPLLDTPFTFFGHSMGALIAFELARYLRHECGYEPEMLFASGRRAPQVPDSNPVTYNLPKDEFIEELGKLDGTPKEVLEHGELMEMMTPLLRADFQLVQEYKYIANSQLQCPISVYGGFQDKHVSRDLLLPWRELTSSRFALHMLPGGHFFLRSSESLLSELLTRELHEVIARSRVGHS
jgi:medium-chain acyl-[acyl-carrier-protein] hydrolase